jgi:hypothetical protein
MVVGKCKSHPQLHVFKVNRIVGLFEPLRIGGRLQLPLVLALFAFLLYHPFYSLPVDFLCVILIFGSLSNSLFCLCVFWISCYLTSSGSWFNPLGNLRRTYYQTLLKHCISATHTGYINSEVGKNTHRLGGEARGTKNYRWEILIVHRGLSQLNADNINYSI